VVTHELRSAWDSGEKVAIKYKLEHTHDNCDKMCLVASIIGGHVSAAFRKQKVIYVGWTFVDWHSFNKLRECEERMIDCLDPRAGVTFKLIRARVDPTAMLE
jgi:hypothetical protein